MRSRNFISAPLYRYLVKGTDPQRKEQTHDSVFTAENLHEAEEHMPLDGSGKRI